MPNGLDRSRPTKKPLAFNARRTGSGFARTGIGSRTPRANSRWSSQPFVAKGRLSPDFSRVTAHVPSSARERNKNARVALCPPAEYTGLKLLMILDRNISKRQEVWVCFATSRCYSLSIVRDYAMPLRQVDVLLHWRQTRSPAQALGKSWPQIKQRRALASLGGSVSLMPCSVASGAAFAVKGSRISHLLHKANAAETPVASAVRSR